MLEVDVEAHGPVFDGAWAGIMNRYDHAAEDHLADVCVHRIRVYLPTQYMYLGHNGGDPVHNPVPPDAGYLVSTIHSRREDSEAMLVLDGGYPQVIYGPWIEGIAPGNWYFGITGRLKRGLSPARFPGYHAFRKISFEVQQESADLAQQDLPPYLAELNN